MGKAVMYGAGNIGRGFIGMLFARSGYEVTFIDVAEEVVNQLNREHSYPVREISQEPSREFQVSGVSAVNGRDGNAVAEAIAGTDIMATAVGVNVLKRIAPNLAEGIRRRRDRDGADLNIIICENLMDANKVLEGYLKEQLKEEELSWFDEHVGLVEASIGRMVPVQTEEMKEGNPLRVCVEPYGYLPVDRAAFKGELPKIDHMVPFEPFDFYLKRKLYVHNMGHAICAYLGMYEGISFIWEAIDQPWIRTIVQNAMEESALALSSKYGIDLKDILTHIQDLLYRFTNAALKDTCERVGRDTGRKLAGTDRLIGAARLCVEQGVMPAYILAGTAGAVYAHLKESGLEQTEINAKNALVEISGLTGDDPLLITLLAFYWRYRRGESVEAIAKEAGTCKGKSLKNIV